MSLFDAAAMAATFDTVEEWENQPQSCCAHCGHVLGVPLPDRCDRGIL